MLELTPKAIVEELDKYIIGQSEAKRAVAIALRNRYRRSQLLDEMKAEITPKNILMVGPTGVGKTEIARRLAKLVNAPFVKVEATKFTEVGYVGRDVDAIIRDLLEAAIRIVKQERVQLVDEVAKMAAVNVIVEILVPSSKRKKTSNPIELLLGIGSEKNEEQENTVEIDEGTIKERQQLMRQQLLDGTMDNALVEIEVEDTTSPSIEVLAGQIGSDMQDMFSGMMPHKKKLRKVKVKDALKLLTQQEAQKMIDLDSVYEEAIKRAEEKGIVFIDEIDKIAGSSASRGNDVSREGVQRDILPIIEGSTVVTKYGPIKTDFILFIAAGAFHVSKVSDLIPELQGRFPVRVDLSPLTKDNFKEILTKPNNALIKQYKALLSTENIEICVEEEAIEILSEIAVGLNERHENIGARRLFTIMEELFQSLFFETYTESSTIVIDKAFIEKNIKNTALLNAFKKDLNKFII